MNLSWVDVIFNLSQMKEIDTVCWVGFTVVYIGFLQTKHFQGTNWNKDQTLRLYNSFVVTPVKYELNMTTTHAFASYFGMLEW